MEKLSAGERSAIVAKRAAEFQVLSAIQRRKQLRLAGCPQHLYKYRSIPSEGDKDGRQRLESLLVQNQLWMSAPASFNDPFDGMGAYRVTLPPHELRQALVKWFQRMGKLSRAEAATQVTTKIVVDRVGWESRLAAAHSRVLAKIGVCALSADPKNPLMWSHYSSSHRGICLQLRVSSDVASLLGVKVKYDNNYPTICDPYLENSAAVEALSQKSMDWAYEHEWRLFDMHHANSFRSFKPEALTSIIFGMRVTDSGREYIMRLLEHRKRRYGTDVALYQAEPKSDRYRLRLSRIK